MFEQFITRLLGMERFSVSNRLENAVPSVIVKKTAPNLSLKSTRKTLLPLKENTAIFLH